MGSRGRISFSLWHSEIKEQLHSQYTYPPTLKWLGSASIMVDSRRTDSHLDASTLPPQMYIIGCFPWLGTWLEPATLAAPGVPGSAMPWSRSAVRFQIHSCTVLVPVPPSFGTDWEQKSGNETKPVICNYVCLLVMNNRFSWILVHIVMLTPNTAISRHSTINNSAVH